MIISCIIGFWYFHLIPASPEHAPMMDVVLLILCLVSPLTLDIFSLLGVFGSRIQEIDMLIVTRITLPICDILQQTLQVKIGSCRTLDEFCDLHTSYKIFLQGL